MLSVECLSFAKPVCSKQTNLGRTCSNLPFFNISSKWGCSPELETVCGEGLCLFGELLIVAQSVKYKMYPFYSFWRGSFSPSRQGLNRHYSKVLELGCLIMMWYCYLLVLLFEEIGAYPILVSLYMIDLSEGDSSYGLGYLIGY